MLFFTVQQVSAQVETEKRSFDISEGYAINTLKEAAQQAEVEFIFSADLVKGVRTSSIQGEFTPLEAFSLMLAETSLAVFQHEQSGVYAITKVSDIQIPESEQQPIEEIDMNTKKNNWLRKLLAGFAATVLASGASTALAQEIDEEVYELSPFVVETGEEVGYLASSTLAGTRVKSDLVDIASSVSIITLEFLEDTASNDLKDVLVYTASTEVGGIGGNFSAGSPGNSVFNATSARARPQSGTRVRGLSSADLTRNFIPTAFPVDTYNVQRIAVNRGPNSALFGLGSPAGIINSTLKRAILQEASTTFSFEVDQYGSHREVLDVNLPLIPEKLAIRPVLLFEESEFEQEPAFERDKRAYIDAVYTPVEDLTLRVNATLGEIRANRPRNIPPFDRITGWFDAGKPTWDPTTQDARSRNRAILDAMANTFTQIANFYDDPFSSERADVPGDGSGLWFPHRFDDGNDFFFGYMGPAGLDRATNANAEFWEAISGPGSHRFYLSKVIQDRGLFDYQKILYDGPNKFEDEDFDQVSLTAEKLFWEDRAGVELVYDKQNYRQSNRNQFSDNRGVAIGVDVNEYLFDGRPNPNFGRPLVADRSNDNESESEQELFRATTFLELDARDFIGNDLINSIVGRHVFTGFYQSSTVDGVRRNIRTVLDTDVMARITSADSLNVNSSLTWASSIHYIGDSLANISDPSDANIVGIKAPQPIRNMTNAYSYDPATNSWGNGTGVSVEKVKYENWSQDNLDALAFIWQGFLLEDHLVTTFSWRQDEVENFDWTTPTNGPQLRPQPELAVMPSDPTIDAEQQTRSYGIVGHLPDKWSPFGLRLSGHYTDAENFQVGGLSQDLRGNRIGFPTGQTEEYGFTIRSAEDKLALRVNWYETAQAGRTIGVPGAFWLYGIPLNVFRLNTPEEIQAAGYVLPWDDPDLEAFSGFDELINWQEVGTTPEGGIDVQVVAPPLSSTQDLVSDGTEIELVYNPVPNWRLMLNVTQQEALQDNTAPLVSQWIEGRRDDWFNSPAGNLKAAQDGRTVADQAQDRLVNDFLLRSAQDGGAVQELKEWTWSFVTHYDFDFGGELLDGFGVGGAMRWLDESAIGFPITEITEGRFGPDVSNPFLGSTELNVDLWVTYRTSIMDGKGDWTIRLGARDINSDEKLIRVLANPDGSTAVARIEQSTLWTLRSTFSF